MRNLLCSSKEVSLSNLSDLSIDATDVRPVVTPRCLAGIPLNIEEIINAFNKQNQGK